MPLMALSEFDGLDDAPRLAQTILGLMPDTAVMVLDRELRIVLMEGDVYARRGYGVEPLVGRGVRDVIPASAWSAFGEHWIAAVAGEPRTLDWASVDERRDYWLHFAPLRTKAGELVGAISVAQDITERVRARERVEHRLTQQAAVSALGSLALGSISFDDLLGQAARVLHERLGADMVLVFEHREEGGLAVRASAGEAPPTAPDGVSAELRRSVRLLRGEGETLLSQDLRSDTYLGATGLEAAGMRSLVAAPVGSGDAAFGVLVACSRRPSVFAVDDEGFVESIANVLMAAVARDRSDGRVAEAESQMAEFWELSLDLLAIFSPDGRFLKVSGAWQQTLGWTPQELIGRPAIELIVAEDRAATVADAAAAAVAGESVPEVVNRFLAKDGSFRWLLWSVRTGPDGTLYSVAKNITEREEERALAHRRDEQLRQSEERFRQGFDHAPIGMTLIDPKTLRYLRVNDAFCRLVGRTREALLALSFIDLSHPDDIAVEQTAAEQLAASTLDSFVTEKRYLRPDGSEVWASLNVTPVRDVDSALDVLFGQMVDITERRAKEASLRDQLDEISWIGEIRRAFEEDRFELHAQPIIDLATGEIVQHELLIRMRGRDGELIPPGAFLPAAEKHGAIRDIDRWVIAQGADLATRGIDVEINISAASIGDPGLVADIERELERTGADPARLVFEITETALLEETDVAVTLAERLRQLGCRFALDDFGSGYGGFHYLKHLPMDFLKIEREFIRDAVTSDADRHVIHAIVGLARGFGLQTIAEGVEDQETLDLLRDFGVDHAQGYLIGRPAPWDLDPSEAPPVLNAMTVRELIRRALDEDSFIERTRPIVDIHTRIAVKHELTLDLPTGDGQTLPPAGSRATVRDLGLSTEIDDLTLRRALRLARHGDAVAIAVSAESLADPDLGHRFEQTIIQARVDTALLTFELPKLGLTANEAGASALVNRLHGLGCAITVDHFSLGEADPGFLKHLPVDCIKIDAGCIEGLTPESPDVQLLRAVVDLARGLGIRTAADGVGDATVLELLEDLGLDQAQGPLFADNASAPPSRVPAPVAMHAERRP
jgi:PAS domain S-box-containing protein